MGRCDKYLLTPDQRQTEVQFHQSPSWQASEFSRFIHQGLAKCLIKTIPLSDTYLSKPRHEILGFEEGRVRQASEKGAEVYIVFQARFVNVLTTKPFRRSEVFEGREVLNHEESAA